MTASSIKPVKVFFVCCGLGIVNRGIESFFSDCYRALRSPASLAPTLYTGAPTSKVGGISLHCIPRHHGAAELLGKMIGRNGYVIEQWTALPFLIRAIRRERPNIIFYSDSNLGFQLFRWRKRIGVPYRLLFSNGGPCHPPFDRTDFVHQVAPSYHEEALQAGESPMKHFMIPYGIHTPKDPLADCFSKSQARAALGLPQNRPVVLSAGWIARRHKRMDHVIKELAQLPKPRPFLQLLGEQDMNSPEIISLAEELLGHDGFSAKTIPHEEMGSYYKAADVFVLASLQEGFGRVYIEALSHGLPVVAHDEQTIRYVVGSTGTFCDMEQVGALATRLQIELKRQPEALEAEARREDVRRRFDWQVLVPRYEEMFKMVATTPMA